MLLSEDRLDALNGLNTAAIHTVMTSMPLTVDEDTDLVAARKIFRENHIRHLPVTHGGKLVGILSERDTRMIALMPEIGEMAVADIMTRNPLCVTEDTTVIETLRKMANTKFGSALVKNAKGEVTGIFTLYDALKLLIGEKS